MAKGDADNLRADLDDGYAKVANLLLEALAITPLSGAEYSVVVFIIRRTYGWAAKGKRQTHKMDMMTAEIISQGTFLSRSGVHKALRRLVAMGVILKEPAKAGSYFAYGMNPDISQWALQKEAYVQLKDCRDANIYIPNGTEVKRGSYQQVCPKRVTPVSQAGHTQVYPERDTPLSQMGHPPIPNGIHPGALSPAAPGAEGTPTDSFTDSSTDKRRKGKNAVAGAPAAVAIAPAPDDATTLQAVMVLHVWHLLDLQGKPTRVLYGRVGALLDQGHEDLLWEWLGWLEEHRPVLPTTAKPSPWVGRLFHEACHRPWEWRGKTPGAAPADPPPVRKRKTKLQRYAEAKRVALGLYETDLILQGNWRLVEGSLADSYGAEMAAKVVAELKGETADDGSTQA